jgi:hypothetical protein
MPVRLLQPAAGSGLRIVIGGRFCHNPGLPPPGAMGCRGGGEVLNQHAHFEQIDRQTGP